MLQAKPMKHFPSEYYCLSGTPVLHAEFCSTVQWDFWQELAKSIWDLSIRQRCAADGRESIVPLPCKDILRCMGVIVRYLNTIPNLVSSKGVIIEVHQTKCYGNGFN